MKKFIILFLMLGLSFSLSSCTSGGGEEDGEAYDEMAGTDEEISDVAAEGEVGEFGVEGDDFEASSDEFAEGEEAVAGADDFEAVETGTDEFAATDEFADTGTDEFADAGNDEFAATGTDEFTETTDTVPADDFTPSDSDELATTYDTSTDEMDSSLAADEMSGMGSDTSYAAAPVQKSLNKMMTTPYTKNGTLINAIYIVRPGDSWSSVSQKIYGSDRTGELQDINGHLASRDMVVGDKIYYNSPQRPTDDSEIKVFYEDAGFAAETYIAQSGDNIRSVGQNLLGHEKSWKELYATNMGVDSKGELEEGTQLRYWGSELGGASAPPVQNIAQNDPPAPPEDDFAPPPAPSVDDMDAGAPPPPPTDDFADVPPPAPAVGSAGTEPPPPPPPVEPPPPKEPAFVAEAPKRKPPKAKSSGSDDIMSMLGDDQTTLIALAVILFAAAALVVVIRKKKSKRDIDFHTATHTQLD